MDLSSRSAECENRTYATWWEQVSEWFDRERWDGRALVSDGAKALVKLALNGLGCPSVPDVFHLLSGLSKTMGTAIARHRVQLQKHYSHLTSATKGAPILVYRRNRRPNHGITSPTTNQGNRLAGLSAKFARTFPSDSSL